MYSALATKMMNNIKVAVIGAGASGLAAAIFAARQARTANINARIALFDANPRVGKKILVTGNGRCNFSNEHVEMKHFRGDSEFAYEVYKRFDAEATVEFFNSLGLYSKSDAAGRLYPLSLQASAVLDVLRYEVAACGINEVCDTKISSIRPHKAGFMLNNEFYADRVIIATGGKAAPVQGSDGSGFSLLRPFGISCTELLPALTPVICQDFTKALKGIRAQGKISIKCDGRVISEDTGEIQYTDYGLSGIPSMQVSRYAAGLLADGRRDVYAVVDSAPSYSAQELKSMLTSVASAHPQFTGEMLLGSIMPKKLGAYLLSEISLNPNKEIGRLHDAVIDRIVSVVKGKKYKISSVKGFSDAQVTAGGIPAAEINASTMELKKVKGLYVCGEIVNVDGECGGYNLQWAWSSAFVAGTGVIQEN